MYTLRVSLKFRVEAQPQVPYKGVLYKKKKHVLFLEFLKPLISLH